MLVRLCVAWRIAARCASNIACAGASNCVCSPAAGRVMLSCGVKWAWAACSNACKRALTTLKLQRVATPNKTMCTLTALASRCCGLLLAQLPVAGCGAHLRWLAVRWCAQHPRQQSSTYVTAHQLILLASSCPSMQGQSAECVYVLLVFATLPS